MRWDGAAAGEEEEEEEEEEVKLICRVVDYGSMVS